MLRLGSGINEAPVIETNRLRLRGHTLSDFDATAAMWADPAVVRYIGGKPFTREDTWTRFLRYAGHWRVMGYGYWLLEEKSTGTFAGEIGFADYQRDIDPPLHDTPEAGWVLAPSAHGKGFATEAVRAIVDWGRTAFGPVPTACIIHPENAASFHVAAKCGYREYRRTTYKGQPAVLLLRDPDAPLVS